MQNIIGMNAKRWLAGGALMVFAGLAQAQWMWLNEKGAKVVSDRPPPASVPTKNILKSPQAARTARVLQEGEAVPEKAAPATTEKAPPTLAERNADFKKRAAEKAEQDKKASEEAAQKAGDKANCDAARAHKQALDSGERMGTVDKNGERGYMDDKQRAEAAARAQKIVDSCK